MKTPDAISCPVRGKGSVNGRRTNTEPPWIEPLESRIAPATLNLAGTSLTYTGSGATANVLTVDISGANYTFGDTAETITLNAAAIAAGFTGNGTNSISGPLSAVNAIIISLGDGVDTFNLNGLVDSLAMVNGTGTDTVNVATGGTAVNSSVSLSAETVNLNSLTGVTSLTISADTLAVNGSIGFSGVLTIQQLTADRPINLGTETAGALSITAAEFNNLLHSGTTRIGNATSGAITISATIVGIAGVLNLKTGAGITDTAGGGLQVGALAIDADASVVLDGANDVGQLAALISDTGASFTYAELTEFEIATVDGIGGITTDVGAGENVTLTGGLTVTQAAGANIVANGLRLLGNASYTLTDPANNVNVFAANVGRAIDFVDADDFTVGTVGGTSGITTSNDAVTLVALNGALQVLNANASANPDIAAGTAAVSLTAGSVGAVDNALTINANAGIVGTGGVTLVGDAISIAAAVNAGTATATLRPFQNGTQINLGGADAAGTLGITDAELDFVTAGILRVGVATSGSITVSAALTPGNASTLSLRSGLNVTGTGALQVTNLALSGNGVNLNGANVVTNLVGTATGSFGTAFAFSNAGALAVAATIDGITGVQTTNGGVNLSATGALAINATVQSAGLVTLSGAGISQTAPIVQTSGAGAVSITSNSAPIALGNPGNNFRGPVTLSNTGAPAAATITDANDLILAGQNIAQQLTINAPGGTTQTGAFTGAGGFAFNGPGTLLLSAANTHSGTTLINGGTLAGSGSVGGPLQVAAGATLAPGTSAGLLAATGVTFAATSTFNVEINGPAAGTQHDQLAITGTVNLGGATLDLDASFTPGLGQEFIIISNDGVDAVTGTFAGIAEDAVFAVSGALLSFSYAGGDGNDVSLSVVPLAVTVVNPKTVTFTDRDGDLVTVKTTKGVFDGSEFLGVQTGATGAGQLQRLVLDGDFTGANITITAKRTTEGGNGFVNVGHLDATGVDLGVVKIAGDLGRISAGTPDATIKAPAVKSLAVESIGLLGSSTQAVGGNLSSIIVGALPKLTVKGDVRAVLTLTGATDGKLGVATIGGSITPFGTGAGTGIVASAGIGSLKIGGDIRNITGAGVSISTQGAIGALSVGGSIVGLAAGNAVQISALGQLIEPVRGADIAIKSLSVRGSVEFMRVTTGSGVMSTNADASIGSITVGGDWIASTLQAGTRQGVDFVIGTADDAKFAGGNTRDNPALFSTIGSFTVKGQALGTAAAGDMFGVVAERIGKAKVGGRTFAFTTGATPEAFFAAPTGLGVGAENPAFDFTIREIGSTTPTPAFGGSNLTISTDGKTATYVDVDGDLVTVKRSAGTFVAGEFSISDNASGGGQLTNLTITAAPDGARVNLSITARPGPNGGNGLVNVATIGGNGVPFGTVTIAGDVGNFGIGATDTGKPGVLALTVHSLRALGAGASSSGFVGGVGQLTVLRDMHDAALFSEGPQGKIGSVVVGGMLGNGAAISAQSGIGSVKIGGSVLVGGITSSGGSIGTISIGGDLVGDGNATIYAFGQLAPPAKGLDLAIKSLTVKGSVERAAIEAGTGGSDTNADASIGKVSIGRHWLASRMLAGADKATDGFLGTADDTKDIGFTTTRDEARFSTIASILITGQALGSTAAGDAFGIVAEQIVKAQIGAVKFKFDKGERDAVDAFALAPTGPGATGAGSDFFLREITV